MATAEAKRPSDRTMARPMRVRRFSWRRQTMGIGRRAKIRSVAMLMEELKTPMFRKMISL